MEIQIGVESKIDEWHEKNQGKPRPHLGVSLIGGSCRRKMWLSFRWAVIEKFNGRTLRLFRRGQMEEQTAVSDLKSAGVDIRLTGQNQSFVNFGSHVSGSVDGVIFSGVPGAEKSKHVWECKTHGQKSFDDLLKNGVQKSKPEHYAQMQGYMLGLDIDRALYYAVNKNTDEIYTERIKLDRVFAQKLIDDAKAIATADRMPEPLSADPSWYQCKFCACHDFCHVSKKTKEVNCRTCAHSTAKDDSTWHCARYNDIIPVDAQRTGCRAHVLHPDLVPWKMSGASGEWSAVYEIDAEQIVNGEDGHESMEMLTDGFSHKDARAVANIFGGTVCS